MKRRLICRWRGHRIDPDPGDLVLTCTRCKSTTDLRELAVERCACGCGNPVGDA